MKQLWDKYLIEGQGQFGVRWQEFGKNDRIVNKEKFFKTEKQREAFCDKLEQKDNFKEFTAWSDDERFK
jgi:hypothetical protein